MIDRVGFATDMTKVLHDILGSGHIDTEDTVALCRKLLQEVHDKLWHEAGEASGKSTKVATVSRASELRRIADGKAQECSILQSAIESLEKF